MVISISLTPRTATFRSSDLLPDCQSKCIALAQTEELLRQWPMGYLNQMVKTAPTFVNRGCLFWFLLCALGIVFSPDGAHAYVTDTGMAQAFYGVILDNPATMCVGVFSSLACYGADTGSFEVTASMSRKMAVLITARCSLMSVQVSLMESMLTQMATCTRDVVMACKCSTGSALSSAKYLLGTRRQTSSLQGKGGW